MGTKYAQLSIEDRCRIASLQEQGRSIRQMAAALDRAPSSIAREIKRNAGCKVGYRPAYAHEQTRRPRANQAPTSKPGRGAGKAQSSKEMKTLRRVVFDRLEQGWSPEQIAGRLARDQAKPSVSHEAIYRFI